MHSCIYEGAIRHQRLRPFKHQFKYSMFMMYLDLAEIDKVFSRRLFWSAKRPAIARFRRSDHPGDSNISLDQAIRDLVEQKLNKRPSGPIRLLTHLRYFGFLMNPVSFFYCFDATGEHLEAVVAEVTNTPWGQRHVYVLSAESESATKSESAALPRLIRTQQPKEFHVSPFMPMKMNYRWVLRTPGENLEVQIENLLNSERVHSASLTLQRREISSARLNWMLVKYPVMTLKVAAGIYWQALKLWWKGARFYPHPDRDTTQQEKNRPSASSVASINPLEKESL